MSSAKSLQNTWSILTQLNTKALRQQALSPFPIAILGRDLAARQWLATALHTDPVSGMTLPLPAETGLYPLPLAHTERDKAARARLVLIALPATQESVTLEEQAIAALLAKNPRLSIIVVQIVPGAARAVYTPVRNLRGAANEIVVDPEERQPFDAELTPLLRNLAPDQEVTLGYHFPALRPALARKLIRSTSMTNAGYSASTGLAELAPALLLPGNIADFMVLTKNQALLAYKLALLMGNDITLPEMTIELAGVLGGGFLWRQTARRLVGLIPGWGLAPKITVAYAGTFITGELVYHWYAYHERLTSEEMRALYARAMAEGKQKAIDLLARMKPTSHKTLSLPKRFRRPRTIKSHEGPK